MMFAPAWSLNAGQFLCLNQRFLENIFGELHWLRGENLYLKQRIREGRISEKRCYTCGMRGHLARACCSKSRSDCNWRTTDNDNTEGSNASTWVPATPDPTPIREKAEVRLLAEDVVCDDYRQAPQFQLSTIELESENSHEITQDIHEPHSHKQVVIKIDDTDSDDDENGEFQNYSYEHSVENIRNLSIWPDTSEQLNIMHTKTAFWDTVVTDSADHLADSLSHAAQLTFIDIARLAHIPESIIEDAKQKTQEVERRETLIKTLQMVFAAEDVYNVIAALKHCTFI